METLGGDGSMSQYIPMQAEIVDIKRETADTNLISLRLLDGELGNYLPGQFVMVSVFGLGECPISITSTPTRELLQICVRKAGRVSTGILSCEVGDIMGIRGPCGNGFPLEHMKKDILIAGGGSGFAALRSLINYAVDRRSSFRDVTVAYGARTPNDLYFRDEYAAWEEAGLQVGITVDFGDDDWKGDVGLVTALFEKLDITAGSAAVCGPPIMIDAVASALMERGFEASDIYVSMERHMKCGIGKCEHCTIGPVHVCTDGPIFTYERVKALEG
jgi:sulfhydrogenase subunit gamma (sulfur reductase)